MCLTTYILQCHRKFSFIIGCKLRLFPVYLITLDSLIKPLSGFSEIIVSYPRNADRESYSFLIAAVIFPFSSSVLASCKSCIRFLISIPVVLSFCFLTPGRNAAGFTFRIAGGANIPSVKDQPVVGFRQMCFGDIFY